MRFSAVGTSSLQLSALGLGTMTWGRDTDEYEAHDQLAAYLEAGGNWIDTASHFGAGAAARSGRRDDGTVCLERSFLRQSLTQTLARLARPTLDIWVLQGYDPAVAPAEIAQTLEVALAAGLANYVALADFPAWQVAQVRAELARPQSLIAGSYEYSLLARGVEADVLPMFEQSGMGVLAWSPLGSGVLTGKYRHSVPADSRAASPHLARFTRARMTERANNIVEALVVAADGLGVTPAELALAWVCSSSQVAGAITGARTAAQLRGLLAAGTLSVPPQIKSVLDEVSAQPIPYPSAGYHSLHQ